MGGIVDVLFGESPSSDITPVSTLSPEQLRILRETLAPFIEGLNLDPSATDLGPASELSLQALEERALALAQPPGGETSSQAAISGILEGGVNADFSGATESGLAAFTDPAQFNELFDAGVTDPAIQALNERILPNISRRFAPSGFFSSERIESDRRALEDVIDITGEQRATQFLDRSFGASVELERSRRGDLDRLEGGVNADFSGATESGLAAFTDPAQFNELFDAGVTDPAIQALNERILPNISRRFAPSGFFSSERIESDRRALEDVIDITGEQRATQFLDRSFGASVELERSRRGDLDRFLQEAGLNTEAILGAIGAGGIEGVDLRNISAILESEQFSRLAAIDKINIVLSALGLNTQENIAASRGGTEGLIGAFLGGGGGAALGKAAFGA